VYCFNAIFILTSMFNIVIYTLSVALTSGAAGLR